MRSFVRFAAVPSAAVATLVLSAGSASAAEAGPDDYTSAVAALKPGDTLNLAPGTYTKGLTISGLNGTKDAPITIRGPSTAVFTGRSCCNTVEITNSSWVVLEGFTLDGKGLPGVFGVSAKGGSASFTHHVTLDGLTIVGHGGSQQTVGISTKTPTWGWVIRRNRIVGAGTGMYLGDSDGSDAFFDAVIEGNLVKDCTGYCVQIKHQTARPPRDGQPTGDSRTILRHNVFLKNDAPSPDGDRPNLLIGGFPASGVGAKDQYEIYGNLFVHNPRESLLQASGRVSIHDNVFVDVKGTAVYLVNHNGPLRLAHVYSNTIYSAGTGIRFVNAASEGDAVFGNLVFATNGIVGTIGSRSENLELPVASAAEHVKKPSITLGAMDFYPLAGKCTGPALPLSLVTGDVARDVDFNGVAKSPPIYRGAYHGSGDNPGWALDDGLKPLVSAPPGGGGDAGPPGDGGSDAGASDGGSAADDGGSTPVGDDPRDGGPSAAPTGGVDEAGGCTTSAGRASSASAAIVLSALLGAVVRRRRRSAATPPAIAGHARCSSARMPHRARLAASLSAAVVSFALAPSALAAVRQVGPGKTYATPCAAFAAASDGDVVEIAAGTYSGDVCAITKDKLTIKAVGGRAHVEAAGKSSGGKAIWVVQGDDTVIEDVELSGAKVPDKNGAGIRQEGKNLTLRRVYFHDNENGILAGSNPESTIVIEDSELAHNGAGDGQSHNMYINEVKRFVLRGSYSHHAKVGHLVKSRALRNEILYNRLTAEDGTSSYELDLPQGGVSFVIGNVIQQSDKTQNGGMLAFAKESKRNPDTSLWVVNNTFVSTRHTATFVGVGAGVPTVTLRNNVFSGPGTVCDQASAIKDANFVGDPSFVNAAAYDYRLKPGSTAIDAGVAAGTGAGVPLHPECQYAHPAHAVVRKVTGALDPGGFELDGETTTPCGGGAPVEPGDAGSDGGTPGSDAGTSTDGGTSGDSGAPATDAGTTVDDGGAVGIDDAGALPLDGSTDDGGGCSLPAAPARGAIAAPVLVFLALVAARRRRRA